MTTVSIVIPAYNHAAHLPRAIDSVLAQSHRDHELIVLDDGSTDATRSVLEGYGGRFHWESQVNMGQSATLNRGWAMSRGDIIGYLSADDVLYPECMRRSVELFESDPSLVLTYCDFDLVDEDSRKLNVVYRPDWRYGEVVLDGECPPGPGAFFRRDAYLRAGGWNPEYRRIPDYEFWLRLGLRGSIRRVPEVLAAYRMHDAGQSFAPVDASRADEVVRAIDSLLGLPELPEELRKDSLRARSNALLLAARLHLYSGRTAMGLTYALRAIRLDPRAALRLRSYRRLFGGLLGRAGQRFIWRLRARA